MCPHDWNEAMPLMEKDVQERSWDGRVSLLVLVPVAVRGSTGGGGDGDGQAWKMSHESSSIVLSSKYIQYLQRLKRSADVCDC